MPNIKSQKKRLLVTALDTAENNSIRSQVKTAIKKFNKAIEENNLELAEKLLPEAIALVDKSCTKGVIHKNTASRKKAHLTKALYLAKNPKAE